MTRSVAANTGGIVNLRMILNRACIWISFLFAYFENLEAHASHAFIICVEKGRVNLILSNCSLRKRLVVVEKQRGDSPNRRIGKKRGSDRDGRSHDGAIQALGFLINDQRITTI